MIRMAIKYTFKSLFRSLSMKSALKFLYVVNLVIHIAVAHDLTDKDHPLCYQHCSNIVLSQKYIPRYNLDFVKKSK